MTVTIREATLEDAAAIAVVHVKTWQEAYAGVVKAEALAALDVDARAAEWRKRLSSSEPKPLVAVDDGVDGAVVVGFGSFGRARDEDIATFGELYAIYIASTHWRAGVGRALLAGVERRLTELGFHDAALWVLEDNPRARGFYEKHGWSADGKSRVVTGSAATGLVEVRYAKRL